MKKEPKSKPEPRKKCCEQLGRIQVINNTVDEYVKVGKSYKADKPISESVTVLCGECYLIVPAGKRLTAIQKGLSRGLG